MADNTSGRRPGDPGDEHNPLEDLFRQLGLPSDPAEMQKMMAQMQSQFGSIFGSMQRVFSPDSTAPILDPTVVSSAAKTVLARHGTDTSPTPEQKHDARVAVELAEGWLDEATSFRSEQGHLATAWSRQEWVTSSLPMWSRLTDPIVTHLAEAMERLSQSNLGELDSAALGVDMAGLGLDKLFEQIRPMMRRAAGAMFAAQMGEALGEAATSVVSSSDLGFPVRADHTPVLIAANVDEFVSDLGHDEREARIYLALREVARQRLFASVGWLEPQIIALVEHYAREIRIDASRLEEAFGDMTRLGADEVAITVDGSLFAPERTPEQEEILGRLETLLALIEGWVDDVVSQAARPWLPGAPGLAEAMRRRRAVGGPTEKALEALVGLTLRPRRVRDAANLWAAVRDDRGIQGRDEVWSHPDLMPTSDDLDDPLGWVSGDRTDEATAKMDDELRRLLEGES